MADAILDMGNTETLIGAGTKLQKEVEQLYELSEKLSKQKNKLDTWNPTQQKQQEIKTNAFKASDTLRDHMKTMNECVESYGKVAVQGAQYMDAADEIVAKQFTA